MIANIREWFFLMRCRVWTYRESIMITEDQAIQWLWQQYKASMTMKEIDYWFDRFAVNREQQRAAGVS